MADNRTIKGTVKAVNQKGTGLTFGEQEEGRDKWYTYTKEEYREPGFYLPSKGDEVEVIVKDDNWVISCHPAQANIVSVGDIPFDDVPAVNPRVEPEHPPKNPTNKSIETQVAVKVAGEIMVALIMSQRAFVDDKPADAAKLAAEVAAMAATICAVYE